MTVGEFFNYQAKKAGIPLDSDEMKAFLSSEWMAKTEIPETVYKGIDAKLISLEDAKNNHPEIKSVYQATSLRPIDDFVKETMSKYGFDDDLKGEINQEKSTYRKVPLLLDKILELQTKKNATTDRTDKAVFTKQIDDLHAQVRALNEQKKQIEDNYAQKEKDIRVRYKLDSLFGSQKTVYDSLDAEERNTALVTILTKALQDKAAVMNFDDDGRFVLINKDGTNFYGDNNQQINPQQFIEKLLSQKKLLVTTPPGSSGANAGNTNQNGQPIVVPTGANGSNGNNPNASIVKGLNNAALNSFQENNANAVSIGG